MVRLGDWSHATVLAAEPCSAAAARDFVCHHLVAHDLQHLVDDLRLVVSELATNALAHARTPFRVTLSREDSLVRLGVQDESAAPPVRAEPCDMDVRGRGLVIVEMLSAEWGVRSEDGGLKSVWACFPVEQLESTPAVPSR